MINSGCTKHMSGTSLSSHLLPRKEEVCFHKEIMAKGQIKGVGKVVSLPQSKLCFCFKVYNTT